MQLIWQIARSFNGLESLTHLPSGQKLRNVKYIDSLSTFEERMSGKDPYTALGVIKEVGNGDHKLE